MTTITFCCFIQVNNKHENNEPSKIFEIENLEIKNSEPVDNLKTKINEKYQDQFTDLKLWKLNIPFDKLDELTILKNLKLKNWTFLNTFLTSRFQIITSILWDVD